MLFLQISCRGYYYFSETKLQELKSLLFSFFNPYYVLVRTKKAYGGNKMMVKEQDRREKQVGATPHFRSAKHRVLGTNFFQYCTLFYSSSLSSFLLFSFSNHNFFRECESLLSYTRLYRSLPLLPLIFYHSLPFHSHNYQNTFYRCSIYYSICVF